MFSDVKDLLRYIRNEKIAMLDFKVIDLAGRWRHMTYPTQNLQERIFEEGTGISLSPYAGYRTIEKSDMKIKPDLSSAFVDPFFTVPTLSFLTNILLNDGTPYNRDPRQVARRAEVYLAGLDLGQASWSPELEFYIFDSVRYGSTEHGAFFNIDSRDGFWQGAEGGPTAHQGYYCQKAASGQCDRPRDHFVDLRSKMVQRMQALGIPVKYHHHEVGGPGHGEIEVHFEPLSKTADNLLIMKYVIKNTAAEAGLTATFMPKPLHGEAANGTHFHQFLIRDGRSLFFDPKGYGGLSPLAMSYICGLLFHTPALMALTNASTNSYRRFGLGLAAPKYLFFSQGNRSSSLRIPEYAVNEREARIEYRVPDATGNPYLSLAGMLMAGLSGVREALDPCKHGFGPFDINVYTLPESEKSELKVLPQSFNEAINALKSDHQFLREGDVFSDELIDAYIQAKLDKEISLIAERPHPYEYELYYDL
jgi:glutamine synthetase